MSSASLDGVFNELDIVLSWFVDDFPSEEYPNERDMRDLGAAASRLDVLLPAMSTAIVEASKSRFGFDSVDENSLEQVLSFIGQRRNDAEISDAAEATAQLVDVLQYVSYGEFRGDDESVEPPDVEDIAERIRSGLERVLNLTDGGE